MRPKKSYLICFTQRSGSNLLVSGLKWPRVAGEPSEYFNEWKEVTPEAPWFQDWGTRSFEDNLDCVFDYGTTSNGVFGSKVLWYNAHYLNRILEQKPQYQQLSMAERLARTFPDVRYIWVTRRDKVRQAVSLMKAKQSDAWIQSSAADAGSRDISFNFQLIDSALRQIVREEASWADYFATAGISPLTVVYEDLVLQYEQTVRRALDYLDIPWPEAFVLPAPRMQKQADTLSEDWVRRYYEAERFEHALRTATNLPAVIRSPSLRAAYLLPRITRQLERIPEPVRRVLHLGGSC